MHAFVRRIFLLMALLLALPSAALGQAPPPDKLDVNTWNVAVGQYVYMSQYGARVPDHLAFGVGLMFNYQRNPLTIYNVDADGNRGDIRTRVVGDLLTGELYGYLGLFKHLAVGLSMPLAIYQSGSTVTDTGEPSPDGDLKAFAWGDLGVHVKGHLYTLKNGISFGAQLTITLPTGQFADNYVGEQSATFRPRLIAEYNHRYLSAAVNLGGLFRIKEAEFFNGNFKAGQMLTYGVGLAVRPAPKVPLSIFLEFFGRSDFSTRVDRNPMEMGVGVGYRLPHGVHLMAGGGAGLLAGIGTPDFRVYLGVKWAPSYTDTDGDGVPDEQDRCPGQKEDRDGFQDDDGCPEPDNDKDGILDKNDKCPNQPEDFDHYQDDDGCPDPDNDGDGVPDKQDNCPVNPGPAKDKGCPKDMLDTDGDGIPDVKDKCPNKPEDKDGFQDDDGCPDLDNDGDSIPDDHDKCPNDPEDFDKHDDADGCPDPDNDGDGVCDDNPTIQKNLARFKNVCLGADKCPGQKETINGYKDTDGCPDTHKPLVTLSAKGGKGYLGRFLTPGVSRWFKGTSTRLHPAAERALIQLAMMLKLRQYKPLRKIVVMAFVEPQQGAARGKKITQDQADTIRNVLVGLGVGEDRISAVGAAGADPKCRSRSFRCRRKNRRVEFFITEIRK